MKKLFVVAGICVGFVSLCAVGRSGVGAENVRMDSIDSGAAAGQVSGGAALQGFCGCVKGSEVKDALQYYALDSHFYDDAKIIYMSLFDNSKWELEICGAHLKDDLSGENGYFSASLERERGALRMQKEFCEKEDAESISYLLIELRVTNLNDKRASFDTNCFIYKRIAPSADDEEDSGIPEELMDERCSDKRMVPVAASPAYYVDELERGIDESGAYCEMLEPGVSYTVTLAYIVDRKDFEEGDIYFKPHSLVSMGMPDYKGTDYIYPSSSEQLRFYRLEVSKE